MTFSGSTKTGPSVADPTEPIVIRGHSDDDELVYTPVRPWSAEFSFTVLEGPGEASLAALHAAGEPHRPEDCEPCQRADRARRLTETREAFEQIGQALAGLARALAEHFETASPKPPIHGPVHRPKNPKHH